MTLTDAAAGVSIGLHGMSVVNDHPHEDLRESGSSSTWTLLQLVPCYLRLPLSRRSFSALHLARFDFGDDAVADAADQNERTALAPAPDGVGATGHAAPRCALALTGPNETSL
jgi:hypothetical protein